jgi:hypothetical protein
MEKRKPKTLRVTFPADGSVWDVPVEVIARDRAEHYACDFGGDVERSLAEDTMPLFVQSPGQIIDWASNQTNWEDLAPHAVRVPTPPVVVDYEDEWCNAELNVIREPT